MTSQTSDPVQRDPALWTLDSPLKLGGVPFGTRATLIRLASGRLVIHSPGPLASGSRESIEKLGEVAAIIAPNLFHHFYVEENARAWPDASLFLAPGLADKQPKLPAGETLRDAAPDLWCGELEQLCVQGMPRMGEVVFYHPASRTLLLTDLAFNLHSVPGPFARTMLRVMGAWDRFGPSRLAHLFMKDKPALRRSIDRILEWDFDRITLTHGDVVETGGHELFERCWREVLPG